MNNSRVIIEKLIKMFEEILKSPAFTSFTYETNTTTLSGKHTNCTIYDEFEKKVDVFMLENYVWDKKKSVDEHVMQKFINDVKIEVLRNECYTAFKENAYFFEKKM